MPATMQKGGHRRNHPANVAALVTVVLLAGSSVAGAHESTGVGGGFLTGFTHPLFGWDHMAAMVAVGLWGAFLGAPAIWQLPIVFPLVMAAGAVLAIAGVPLPAVEVGIAASAVVLGIMVASAARPPFWVAALIVGMFAIFHGHAHGTELPAAASIVAYAVGFVVGTGLLHLIGIFFGLTTRWSWGAPAVRTTGAVIALAGVAFLSGIV
jgi:urease accessory protein